MFRVPMVLQRLEAQRSMRRTLICRGMLYVKALRSTYPHAKILRVEASKAEKLPGVVAVLTRDDLKGKNAYFGPVVKINR
jgi:CO/xanthine dehydrogenase Mo-binding subunit